MITERRTLIHNTAMSLNKRAIAAAIRQGAAKRAADASRHWVLIGLMLGCIGALSGTPALASLPDGRVYEAVSPVETEGSAAVYVPAQGAGYTDVNSRYGIITARPFQVAPDGNAVVYEGDPPPTGPGGQIGQSNGNAYVARRGPDGGWTASDLQPLGTLYPAYRAFSGDLSVGVLQAPSLAANDPQGLYSYATAEGAGGEYVPLHQEVPQSEGEEPLFAGGNLGGGGVPTFTHLLFRGRQALLPGEGALERELREAAQSMVAEGKRPSILYDSVASKLSVVNVLPDGKTDANAAFGALPNAEGVPGIDNVISADGSRVFWTDATTGDLYVRENSGAPTAKTVQIDAAEGGCGTCAEGSGRFLTASSDGSKAFFTDEQRLTSNSTTEAGEPDLYEYNVATAHLSDLTVDANAGEHADVQGVVGVSEDGSYIYFVARGMLANNENANKEKATAGADNLYLSHEGHMSFIAMLSAEDGSRVIPFEENSAEDTGDWQTARGYRTAEVTPDGRGLVFMSNRRLTGYDNEYSYVEKFGPKTKVIMDEVFVYEAGSSELHCASCNPSGQSPVATEFDSSPILRGPFGGYIPITQVVAARSQPRVVSDNGNRVFFDSGQPLVPQDTNGWMDVYEWERDGTGSCNQAQGCVYLLSGGTYPENAYLIGADASGENVFFITAAQLVARDRNDLDDVYDTRVNGVQPLSPPVCEGTGCQGVTLAPPIFATPASVTFAGVGNFPPPVGLSAKPKKAGKPKRCTRGAVRRHGKCVKKPTHKRKPRGKKSTKGRK